MSEDPSPAVSPALVEQVERMREKSRILDIEDARRREAWDRTAEENRYISEHCLDDKEIELVCRRMETTVPPRYANAVTTNPDALAWLDTTLGGDPEGLLLLGATGRGKTHIAYSLIRHIIAADCSQYVRGPGGIIAGSVPTLLAECRPGKPKIKYVLGDPYEVNPLEDYKKCGILFLDDLGAEKSSEWTGEVLYQIVDHRYNHMLPLIVGSNLPPAELAGAIGDRLASRLTEMCRTVVIKGDDRRRMRAS